MRELDELDRKHGLGAMPTPPAPVRAARTPRTRGRRGSNNGRLAGVITTALVVGLVAFAPGSSFESIRRLVGAGPDRLAAAPPVPESGGSYGFLLTANGRPVGYDPCEPVRYQVNTTGAPADWRDLVDTAVQRTEQATGLRFEDAGITDDRDFFGRRTGFLDRPLPVLIGWADAGEQPGLDGDVAGQGGSVTGTPSGLGRTHFVTGSVLLDRELFAAAANRPERRAEMQAIVDHEFGHLVGLDHVDDPGELMNPVLARTGYGPGDLEGLARLGNIPCG